MTRGCCGFCPDNQTEGAFEHGHTSTFLARSAWPLVQLALLLYVISFAAPNWCDGQSSALHGRVYAGAWRTCLASDVNTSLHPKGLPVAVCSDTASYIVDGLKTGWVQAWRTFLILSFLLLLLTSCLLSIYVFGPRAQNHSTFPLFFAFTSGFASAMFGALSLLVFYVKAGNAPELRGVPFGWAAGVNVAAVITISYTIFFIIGEFMEITDFRAARKRWRQKQHSTISGEPTLPQEGDSSSFNNTQQGALRTRGVETEREARNPASFGATPATPIETTVPVYTEIKRAMLTEETSVSYEQRNRIQTPRNESTDAGAGTYATKELSRFSIFQTASSSSLSETRRRTPERPQLANGGLDNEQTVISPITAGAAIAVPAATTAAEYAATPIAATAASAEATHPERPRPTTPTAEMTTPTAKHATPMSTVLSKTESEALPTSLPPLGAAPIVTTGSLGLNGTKKTVLLPLRRTPNIDWSGDDPVLLSQTQSDGDTVEDRFRVRKVTLRKNRRPSKVDSL